MSDVIRQNGPPEAQERNAEPLQRAVSEYRETYGRLLAQEQVRISTREQLQALVQQVHQQNTDRLPEMRNLQQQSSETLRQLIVLAAPELNALRTRIRAELMSKLDQTPIAQQQELIERTFQQLRMSDVTDVFLADDLLNRRFDQLTRQLSEQLLNAPQDVKQIGFQLIDHPESRPDMNAQLFPQQAAFGLYTFQIFQLGRYPEILQKVAEAQPSKKMETFVRLTYPAYQNFLVPDHLDPNDPIRIEKLRLFCPNQDWYENLCVRAGIPGKINGIRLYESPEYTALQGDFRDRANILETQAQDRVRAGDQPGSEEYLRQAEAYRDLDRRLSDAVAPLTIAQRIQTEDRPMPGGQDFLNRPGQAVGDVIHNGLEGINHAMDWVGSLVPAPTRLQDMTVSGALFGALRLVALSSAALNVAGLGVSGYIRTTNFVRLATNGEISKAFEEIPKFVGDLYKSSTGALLTAGMGVGIAVAENPQEAGQYLSRQWDRVRTVFQMGAGTEVGAAVADRIRQAYESIGNTVRPAYEAGKDVFQRYILDNGFRLYEKTKKGVSDGWNQLVFLANQAGVKIEDYQGLFEAQSQFVNELNGHLAGKKISIRVDAETSTVSSANFGELLADFYLTEAGAVRNETNPIPLDQLISRNFFSPDEQNALRSKPDLKEYLPSEPLRPLLIEQARKWRAQHPRPTNIS